MPRYIDPDRSADCHASGTVPIEVWAINEFRELAWCAHHFAKAKARLAEQGWTFIPVSRTTGKGVGTEGTPVHYALGDGVS